MEGVYAIVSDRGGIHVLGTTMTYGGLQFFSEAYKEIALIVTPAHIIPCHNGAEREFYKNIKNKHHQLHSL